jgi:hypothetical protein
MDNVFAVFGLHKELDSVNDNVSNLTDEVKDNKLAEKIVEQGISHATGKVIGMVRGLMVVELSVENASALKDIQQQIVDQGIDPVSVGVGSTIEEAQMAYEYCEKNMHGQIKVYDNEVMSDIEKEAGNLTAAAEVKKAEGDDFNPISDEEKMSIKQALDQIKQNKQLFDQIKQQSPEVYAGVVGIVNSLALMLKEEKVKKDQKVAQVISNLANAIQEKRDRKNVQDKDSIINELNVKDQLDKDVDWDRYEETRRKGKEEDKASRAKAKDYAKKVGHTNPEFFHQLLKAFKD